MKHGFMLSLIVAVMTCIASRAQTVFPLLLIRQTILTGKEICDILTKLRSEL